MIKVQAGRRQVERPSQVLDGREKDHLYLCVLFLSTMPDACPAALFWMRMEVAEGFVNLSRMIRFIC